MELSKGKGYHGIELSQDIKDFLTHCYNNAETLTEAAINAGVSIMVFKKLLINGRAHQRTIDRIKVAMQKQEVC